jgi:predicted metal-binding protein
MNTRLGHLPAEVARRALALGAANAVILPAGAVSIEDALAAFCHTPRCPAFGRSRNCPPYSIRPDQLRRRIDRFAHALVFKIDVPACHLLTEAHHPVARKIHIIAAALERYAQRRGIAHRQGFGAGSCKPLFCPSAPVCAALGPPFACRYPRAARPSLSGAGINAFKLAEDAGWPIHPLTAASDPHNTPDGLLMGLLLLG